MRRSANEITSKSEIEEIISKAQVCRLGMADGNIPYIVPMSFGYKDGKVYFHAAKEGRKIGILRKNPNVCIEWDCDTELIVKDQACEWGMKYRSVIAQGSAAFVQDEAEKIKALSLIMKQYSGSADHTFSSAEISRVEIIRADITEITGKKSRD